MSSFQHVMHTVSQVPQSKDGWLSVAEKYESRWQLPHCVGAIDGKHISIVKPHKSGSLYFNYKGFFSVVLMAVIDADCNFIYVDVGAQGRISDGGVFHNTNFARALEEGKLNLPDAKPLVQGVSSNIPYFIVGDDAFPLKTYLMKPYSRRNLSHDEVVANYRLSRARRTSENAFGILANVFRVFHTPIYLEPRKVVKVVLAACALHNYLRRNVNHAASMSRDTSNDQEIVCDLVSLKARQTNHSQAAKDVREELKKYFATVGAVEWQERQATAF